MASKYVHEPNKQWYRNLSGEGPIKVEIGGESYVVEVSRGDEDEQ